VPRRAARLERLETTFAEELAERIQSLNKLLLRVEQGDVSKDVLASLRRELHGLKGGARAIEAASVEQLAHAAEAAVLAVREGSAAPSQEWCDALYAAVDALAPLHDGTRTDAAQLIETLRKVQVASAEDEAQAAPSAPTPQPVVVEAKPTPQPAPAAAPAPALVVEPRRTDNTAERAGSVRVALRKLDTLLTESGELSVAHLRVSERLGQLRTLQRGLEGWHREWRRSRPIRARLRRADAESSARDVESLLRLAERADQELQRIVREAGDLVGGLSQTTAQLGSVAGAIGQEVMAIRLLPASTVFLPLERLVRDLCRQTGKEARLVLVGNDTEVDRRILDELRDPLMHMVRNTIDHGIEAPEARAAAGKPQQGTLRLTAMQRGDRVQITVEDDGRGLDVDEIRASAIRKGLVTLDRAESLDAAAAIDLIFQPGFSTRASVSEISGRGVGMDVVRAHVERLGGEVGVRTTLGVGTCFTLTVPLTLATTRVLLVEDNGQIYAVPSSTIERTGRVRMADLLRIEGRRALQIDGRAVPVIELGDVLQRPRSVEDAPRDEWRPYFVLPQGERAVALLTDRLVDEQELVIKALGAPLRRVRHVGGAAVLGTGAVVVILNPADLTKTALGNLDNGYGIVRNAEQAVEAVETQRRRVLVVDDSVMTRTLERSILDAAGYEVLVASDGQQALDVLRSTKVDVIVSDVEMPRMSGLELTIAVRQDERLRHLPVVLVTSLDSPEHVERGAAAGADAYIVKGRFDQNDLLQTVGRLL